MGLGNPDLVRFMDEIRTLALTDPDFAVVRKALVEGQALGEARYAEFVASGAARPMPWLVARALMLGPAYDFLRSRRVSAEATDGAAELLAEAAWQAVRA